MNMQNIIIANWKSNPDSPGRSVILARSIEQKIGRLHNAEVVIAPPHPFLIPVSRVLEKSRLGAQDMFWADTGPYTGEVSWHQLKNIGVGHVILGHSERRKYLGETDDMINKKNISALENSITPILCIGEGERSGNEISGIVGEQLKRALGGVSKNMVQNLIVAYEPAWAISTNPGSRPDTPDNAFRALVYIRKVLSGIYGRKTADLVRVIYGGSVSAKNIQAFLTEGRMQGALVGSASLKPQEFVEIINLADMDLR